MYFFLSKSTRSSWKTTFWEKVSSIKIIIISAFSQNLHPVQVTFRFSSVNKLCLSRCKASEFFMEELESKTAKLKVFQGKRIVFVKFRKSNYVDSNNSLIVHDVLLSQWTCSSCNQQIWTGGWWEIRLRAKFIFGFQGKSLQSCNFGYTKKNSNFEPWLTLIDWAVWPLNSLCRQGKTCVKGRKKTSFFLSWCFVSASHCNLCYTVFMDGLLVQFMLVYLFM